MRGSSISRSIALTIVIIAAATLLCSATASSVHFGYDDQCEWENIPNSQCYGYRQSPINIDKASVHDGSEIGLQDLQISYLNQDFSGSLKNNGHSIQFNPSNTAGFTTKTHRGEYELQQFHFHWGEYNYEGSEHRVDGKQFSGELHLVHKTTSPYKSDQDWDYYMVLGVLLESDSSLSLSGTIWETLIKDIPSYNNEVFISTAGSYPTVKYEDLLPSCNPDYYSYDGSLTTPLCTEIVLWVLLRQPLSVPEEFFYAVRNQVEDSDGYLLKKNFRHAQDLYGRRVYQHV